MKIFLSSEMKSKEDMERRKVAIEEIELLGHEVKCFEKLPARPLPGKQQLKDICLELVRQSELVMVIIDDSISEVMEAEIREAFEHHGSSRIFLYFTKDGERDKKAIALRDSSKQSHIMTEFDTPAELKTQIARSIASYLNDAFNKPSPKSIKLLDEEIELHNGERRVWSWSLDKGNVVTVSCLGNQAFIAGFYSRKEFFERRGKGFLGAFDFGRIPEDSGFTDKRRITEDDDYYFVIAAPYLMMGTCSIEIDIKMK